MNPDNTIALDNRTLQNRKEPLAEHIGELQCPGL
jgi:hypothetical protein